MLAAMTPGGRIKAARKRAHLTQGALGERLGVTQSVVSDWERDTLQSWRDYKPQLARALGIPEESLEDTQLGRPTPSAVVHTSATIRGIDVVGEVQGGAFKLALEYPEEDRYQIPVALQGYEGIRLRALKVLGPSVDQLYPDGTFVIVADAQDTDVRPGDRVVVYRSQGELREATIKEVAVEEGGRVALLPRSNHPDHQDRIYLDVNSPDDQDRPEIAFVVVGSFRKEERPPPPIQWRRSRR
jgi:transcriptional regulator with XRE-family HTH domain